MWARRGAGRRGGIAYEIALVLQISIDARSVNFIKVDGGGKTL
jgi:hypothetical protein